MKRTSKRALYESIMKDVAKTVKKRLNESNVADALGDNIYGLAFGKLNYIEKNIDEILEDDRILKKVAGYIVEEQVKDMIEYLFTENYEDARGYHAGVRIKQDEQGLPRYVDGGNNWWDFILDGQKVEIKAFQKGKLYSNVKATANQVRFKDQITFMLVEYTVNGGILNITGIAFVDGNDIEFDAKYDRLVKNPNIKFRRPEEFSDDEEDYNL